MSFQQWLAATFASTVMLWTLFAALRWSWPRYVWATVLAGAWLVFIFRMNSDDDQRGRGGYDLFLFDGKDVKKIWPKDE